MYYYSQNYREDQSQFSLIQHLNDEDHQDLDVEITPLQDDQIVQEHPIQTCLNLNLIARSTQVMTNKESNTCGKTDEKYISDINIKLIHKYGQRIEQSSIDEESELKNIKRKKVIKKEKNYHHKKFLNQKLNKCKKHLTKLWANRIFMFLNDRLQKYQIDSQYLNSLKRRLSKSRISIAQFASILKSQPQISQIILKQEKQFLDFIQCSNLSVQCKFTLFQTFQILKEGLREPDNLKTWDFQQKKDTEKSQQIYKKLDKKNYQEIHELVKQQYQKQKKCFTKNKCSFHNNLTYFWIKYLKDIAQNQFFQVSFCNYSQYTKLCNLLYKAPSIENIKQILQIKWFAKYIQQQKINSKEIIKEILCKTKVNLLNKLNMLLSLKIFIITIESPSILKGWVK